jgi:hypothetical protein
MSTGATTGVDDWFVLELTLLAIELSTPLGELLLDSTVELLFIFM